MYEFKSCRYLDSNKPSTRNTQFSFYTIIFLSITRKKYTSFKKRLLFIYHNASSQPGIDIEKKEELLRKNRKFAQNGFLS